ncbi:putative O-methyltransferase [Talaromyces proteolyticus]|uniref:O-methyltransferase n=1 Tax=Talaromyces proteolyticus TaxID=1131652 RepID=A0AAD4KRP1_9EURO|nr:putative O-methyltransferase [Talaromyces proteolyticus]KAH8694082.1 putative O-methyltransferase [Talaromyces proteolyticus]
MPFITREETVSLETLALKIGASALEIREILNSQKAAYPTLNEKGYLAFSTAEYENHELRKLRNTIINHAHDLIRLASGPTDHILGLAFSAVDPSNLGIIVRFGIPQALPLGSKMSAEDLAKAVNLPTDVLTRVVRLGVCNGIFQELETGWFGHSASSALLAKSEHLRNIAVFGTHELSSALIKLPDALKQQQELGAKGPHAAFNLAYPDYKDAFDYFNNNGEGNSRYHTYLEGRVNTSRWAVNHLKSSWRWSTIGSSTVIDCGGSIGHTCMAVAPLCPKATFIVQDFSEEPMAVGQELIRMSYPELQNQIKFMKHDFFSPQTVTADIYIFRHILHDWSDEDCLRILRALEGALKPGAKVLVSEGVVPESAARATGVLDEKQIRIEDAFMLSVHMAKERTVSDFVALFRQASPKFRFCGVTGGSDGAFQSLLEFAYTDI